MNLKRGLDEMVYDLFIDELYNGVFHAGEKIDPEALTESFQISRTPVIQALKRLASEKILEVSSGGKYFIPVPDEKQIREICEVRYLFEQYAIEQYLGSGNHPVLSQLYDMALECRGKMKSGEELECVKADLEFHRSLVRLTGNTCLYEAYIPVLNRFIGIKYAVECWPDQQIQANDRHIHLMEAIIQNQKEQALRELHQHIFLSMERIVSAAKMQDSKL